MKKLSFCFVILSGLLWATSGVFVRVLVPYGFTSLQLTAVRGGVSFLAVALFALFFNRQLFRVKGWELLLCLAIGLSLFGTSNCYFYSLQLTSISTAVVLMYIAPAIVMLFSVLFLKERITPLKLVSLGTMLFGCVLVSGILGDFKPDPVGILIGLLSGISFASYNILTKVAVDKGMRPLSVTLYAFFFASSLSLALSKPSGIVTSAASALGETLPLLIGIGLVSYVSPYLLYTLAMRALPVGTVSALGIVEPMAATLFGVFFFKEELNWFSGLGIAAILLAVLLLGLAENRQSQLKIARKTTNIHENGKDLNDERN